MSKTIITINKDANVQTEYLDTDGSRVIVLGNVNKDALELAKNSPIILSSNKMELMDFWNRIAYIRSMIQFIHDENCEIVHAELGMSLKEIDLLLKDMRTYIDN